MSVMHDVLGVLDTECRLACQDHLGVKGLDGAEANLLILAQDTIVKVK